MPQSVEYQFKPFQVVSLLPKWRKSRWDWDTDFIIINGFIRGKYVMYSIKSMLDGSKASAWSGDLVLPDLRTKAMKIKDKVNILWTRQEYYKEYLENKACN